MDAQNSIFGQSDRILVARDLGGTRKAPVPSAVFDLGSSGGSDIARHKDAMIGEALAGRRKITRRR